jgi:hypothetical protein
MPPGKRSTDPSDYPVGKADYALRSVEGVRRRAREQGEHVGRFVERLLEGPLPWTKMRQAYGLLRLCERYGAPRVEALCARALAFEVLDVRRLERMLKAGADRPAPVESAGPAKIFVLPSSRFARPVTAFVTRATAAVLDEASNVNNDSDGGAA